MNNESDFQKNKREAFLESLDNPALLNGYSMDAQDPDDFAFMREYIPEVFITNWGGFCPFQCYGYFGEHPFYMRMEDGYATMRVATTDSTDAFLPGEGNILYSASIKTKDFTFPMSLEFFLEVFFELFEKLDVAPFLYRFKNIQAGVIPLGADGKDIFPFTPFDEYKKLVEVELMPTGDREYSMGWGVTREEAYADACKPLSYEYLKVYKRNMSPDEVEEKIARLEYVESLTVVANVTDDVDERVLPLPKDYFKVSCPEGWRNGDGSFTIR